MRRFSALFFALSLLSGMRAQHVYDSSYVVSPDLKGHARFEYDFDLDPSSSKKW